jgi:hypothetical protein
MTPLQTQGRREEVVLIRVDGDKYWATLEDGKERPLKIDETYQRALDDNRVAAIRAEWDRVASGNATFSLRKNGDLFIVDGQHMVVAAILEHEDAVIGEIFTGISVSREADLRLKRNNRRADTALEKFYAQLAKERETPGEATAIAVLLAEYGAHVNRTINQSTGINCIATVRELYKRDEQGLLLRWTLTLLRDTFGQLEGPVVGTAMMKAVAWFLAGHQGEYDRPKLIGQIDRVGLAEIVDVARGFRRAMGGPDWINQYRALIEIYNRAVRNDAKKLEMKTQRWGQYESGPGWGRGNRKG